MEVESFQVTYRETSIEKGPQEPAASRDGTHEIYLMKANGSKQHRLTKGVSDKGMDRHRWSPDGTKIAYVAYTGRERAAQQGGIRSPSDD